ncbi:HK97 family phage prohead protease [Caloranaerobacter ferrireducens]|uniref:HK97 family phage prohead protease n=1 Tax=Caloranaerobacter ferrireducens TaxID=1323370 RepID=UPI00084DFBF4|nr:HK97 family phage prohead protease [Caloranaerobacter ferrireducens]
MKLERRTVNLTELRVQNKPNGADGDKIVRTIEGHAAVFNQWSETLGGFFPYKERVLPGAFKDSIEKDDIRALFNHNPDYVLGRNKSGTLHLEEDEKGLKVIIYPPDTQWARDLMVSIERGDISQMSFGFIVESDRWGLEDGVDVRELQKVKLFDVSPVTYPAYSQTDVGVRSMDEIFKKHREDERQKKAKHAKQKLDLYKRKIKLLSKY